MSAIADAMVLALVAGGIGLVAAYLACEARFLAWEQRIPSPLVRTLVRAGAGAEILKDPTAARDIERAQRACPTCPAIASCRESLDCGGAAAYRSFCPNAGLVERLTR